MQTPQPRFRRLTADQTLVDRTLGRVIEEAKRYAAEGPPMLVATWFCDRFMARHMLIPPGGGPAPHRHDFEEMFSILEGEIQFTFRGETSLARDGDTVNVPSNAPHFFTNATDQTVRLLCMCAPADQEEFFAEVGIQVATRTTPAPPLDDADQADFLSKATELAPKYRTELLGP